METIKNDNEFFQQADRLEKLHQVMDNEQEKPELIRIANIEVDNINKQMQAYYSKNKFNHLDNTTVNSLYFEGMDPNDAPKYCDAYIASGNYKCGSIDRQLTEKEIEYIEDNKTDFDWYELLSNQIR